MVKKKTGERKVCACGNVMFNKRSDATKCEDCRRKTIRNASYVSKAKSRQQRILEKARLIGVRNIIEKEKVAEILKKLEEESEEDEESFEPLSFHERIEKEELRPFRELIDNKAKRPRDEKRKRSFGWKNTLFWMHHGKDMV